MAIKEGIALKITSSHIGAACDTFSANAPCNGANIDAANTGLDPFIRLPNFIFTEVNLS